MPDLDQTHDPSLPSWVDSANDPACDFPIHWINARRADANQDLLRAGVRDPYVADLDVLRRSDVVEQRRLHLGKYTECDQAASSGST